MMHLLLDWVVVLSVLGRLICAKEWVATGTGRGDSIRCYEDMLKDGDISNLLIDVTTPDKIDAFCRRYTDQQKCVADHEHFLSNNENTKYLQKTAGIRKFYLNVCPPGTDLTPGYKGNSPCFKLIKNEILSCGSDLPDMESYRMRTNVNARCCALQTHRECLKRVTAENCGKEAASVVEKIVLRYFQPQLSGCNGGEYCSPRSSTLHPYWSTNRGSTVKWNRRTSQGPPGDHHHHIEKEDDWGWSTEAEEWKKHKKHNGAPTLHNNLVVFAATLIGFVSRFVV